MNPNLFKKVLINKAKQSICRYSVAALGFNSGGECVAKSVNKPRFNHPHGGLHAEMQIMSLARRKGIKTIFICRIGGSGNILPIHPCKTCAEKAKELGIKIVSLR